MIMNGTATIIIDGVSMANTIYKRNEDTNAYAHLYLVKENVVDGVQDGLTGVGGDVFVITGEKVGYVIEPIALFEGTTYDIKGTVIPGDTTVFMSAGFKKGDINALKDNVIASAYADKNGEFKFEDISYNESDGVVSMWVTIPLEYAAVANITYTPSAGLNDTVLGTVLTYSFINNENKYQKPYFTITGTCTYDIRKVYVSQTENTSDAVRLAETLKTSASTSSGKFTVSFVGEYGQNYVVWCSTVHNGSFTVENITTSEDSSTCLSGDTLITMADGTLCRMDAISIGDEVLSNKDLTTKVCSVRRGNFNTYHTIYTFEDGTKIDETHAHRFYNVEQEFWQRLCLWNIGEHALNKDGEKIALIDIERIDEKAEMFGIWTESGCYYANGLLSGAASCNKELLKEVSAEKAVDMMLSADEDWLLRLMGMESELP